MSVRHMQKRVWFSIPIHDVMERERDVERMRNSIAPHIVASSAQTTTTINPLGNRLHQTHCRRVIEVEHQPA